MSNSTILLSLVAITLTWIAYLFIKLAINYLNNIKLLSGLPGFHQFIPSLIITRRSLLSKYFYTHTEILFTKVPELVKKYGSVFKIAFGHQAIVVVTDTEFHKVISTRGGKTVLKEELRGDRISELFGGADIFSVSDETVWRRHRLLLNPAFTDDKLSSTVVDVTNKTVSELVKNINADHVRNISEDMSSLTLDVVGRAGFGYEFGCTNKTKGGDVSLSDSTASLINAFPFYILTPFKFLRRNFKVGPIKRVIENRDLFCKEISSIIEKRRNSQDEDVDESNDILSLLIRASDHQADSFSIYELIENCFIFIVAGHETTSHTLTFALYLLSKYQHVQEEAFQYIKNKIPDYNSRNLDYHDYQENLMFIHNIFDETLRLYPVAVGITRKIHSDITFKNHVIPKGCSVIYNWSHDFRSEEHFKDANEFVPSRWEKSEPPGSDLDAKRARLYTPFGVGNRSCIGRRFAKIESVLVLARLISCYKITLEDPSYDLSVDVEVTLHPVHPIRVVFTPRED
ncbi:cholesterol 24-hydroxylase [Acrasis kona]|uniref:Cholesterol 24-hydroxylase n=1 Tax=Acrasis kona TaxID=1008807 RepID=A0AAW2YNZ0_9EUKA